MPVATVDGFVDADKAQNLCRRRKSPPIVEATSGSSGPGASFQTDSPPSSSMIPCHSPILNLSPNMSPESQPNSTSPVFELLDSSGRRTVQDLYGSLSHLTQGFISTLVNEEPGDGKTESPTRKKRKVVEKAGASVTVPRHPTSRPRSLRRSRQHGRTPSESTRRHREVQAARQLGGSSAMDTHASGQTTSQGESSRAGHSQATMPSSIREPHREAPHPAHINQHRPLLIDFSNVPGSANRPPTQSSVHAYSLPLQLAATGPPLSGGRGQPPMAHSLPVTSHSHLPMYPINMHQFGQGHTTTAAMVTQLHTATQPTVYHHHHHRHQPQVPNQSVGIGMRQSQPQPILYRGQHTAPSLVSIPAHASTAMLLQDQVPQAANMTRHPLEHAGSSSQPYSRHLRQSLAGRSLFGGGAGVRHLANPHSQLNNAQYPNFLLHLWAMIGQQGVSGPYRMDLTDEVTEIENYEALLSLAERLGETKPRGLNKSDIERLPSYKFKMEMKRESTKDQSSCVVCMCDFEQKQMLRVLPCSHEFHSKCVDKWLRSNRTCPICRSDASKGLH